MVRCMDEEITKSKTITRSALNITGALYPLQKGTQDVRWE
jgi:hypothetical protein